MMDIAQIFAQTKKVKFILLNSIGDACIDRSVTDQEMEDAVKYLENITLL